MSASSSSAGPPAPPWRSTRGRTRPGRLRLLDEVVLHREQALLGRRDGPFARAVYVDLGFGEEPWTTLESAALFRTVNPDLPVLGVESEPFRVERATRLGGDRAAFRVGGFELPLLPGETVRLVRVMNVLRQYREHEAPGIHARLGRVLLPGGLLVEGTSCALGSILTAHFLRATAHGLRREGLLFSTDFARGFAPLLFRDHLPRDLRRRVHPGEPITEFFAAWTAAWEEVRATGVRDPEQSFAPSVAGLATRVAGVVLDPALVQQGHLLWCPPDGVPLAGAAPGSSA